MKTQVACRESQVKGGYDSLMSIKKLDLLYQKNCNIAQESLKYLQIKKLDRKKT